MMVDYASKTVIVYSQNVSKDSGRERSALLVGPWIYEKAVDLVESGIVEDLSQDLVPLDK